MPESRLRAIIHVDMDAFYASVERHDHPEWDERPVIVGGLGPRGVVSAASYEARRFGVHSALPMVRARRLCPNARFVRPRLARYREVSQQVFNVFHDITPLVEGLSLDEAFLDVTGSLKLFGDREVIGRRLRERIREATGLQASVGMAHNKFLAKLASDAEKPAGFVSVPLDGVQAFLDPMPIGRLWGIGRKTEPKLRQLGLLTIGQLRRADPMVLKEALGNRVAHFQRLACGEDDREVMAGREDKSISHEVTFDQDVASPRALKAEMQHLAEAVMRRVRGQQLVARTVHIKVRDHRFRTITRSLTLRAPTGSTRAVYQVARSLLQRWLSEHGNTPVRLVGVGVSGLEDAPNDGMQPSSGLDATLDRITGKFGTEKLTRALALDRPARPEPKKEQ